MMIRVDKFFIQTLQEAGYDIDFKRLRELYNQSRQHPEYLARKRRNERKKLEFSEFLHKHGDVIDKVFND